MKVQTSRIVVSTDDPQMQVFMNPELFENIVYSLLDNAIKYDLEGGAISIEINASEKLVVILFKDSGPGIPKQHQTHIFEKFYRVPNLNVHDVKGHGLGLYYVKKHLEIAGGCVKLLSSEKGSVFQVEIPRVYEN